MERYMNMGIKEVISLFPAVGDILNQYDIGCVTCSMGSCLLKDIITVHGLDKSQEAELMARIENAVYPDRKVDVPSISSRTEAAEKTIKYSPPVKRLVEEHDRIKRFLALIPKICEVLEAEQTIDSVLINECVYFIKNYADKFHHAKEEDILFKYTDESQDIIKVMYDDHKTGRALVRAITEGLNKNDRNLIIESLSGYKELLTGHIKKEDEILYPWIDRKLSTREVGELYSAFLNQDNITGNEITKEFDVFINKLVNNLNFQEVII